jgi:hypothetical protein
MELLRELPDVF